MVDESKNKKYIVVNNIKVFVGLPVICKKTMTIDSKELKNNEEFEVINVDSKTIEIKNDRLTCIIKHTDFKHFDMAYCITTHVSQGSTYNFPYSIYEYKYFNKKLLYTAMSRSTNKSNINFIDIYLKSEVGYIYTITDNNNKVYIGSTNSPDQRLRMAASRLSISVEPKSAIDREILFFSVSLQSEGIKYSKRA